MSLFRYCRCLAFNRASENDPGPKAGYEFAYIGDVPSGATVAPIDEYELDDSERENIESAAEKLNEPGDYTAIGILPLPESDLQDYTPLPYSRPSNGPNGYYVDVGEKVVLITMESQANR